MKKFIVYILFVVISGGMFPLAAQQMAADNFGDFTKPLPLDSSLRVGQLKNGIRYYIRVNRKPEHRAELRLAVNAGSLLEDDNQKGLAHLVEHMAFDGTEHFQKHEIVNYLESVGMQFGADLNAYTSFDETVYMLQIPTDTESIVDKGFQILADWGHAVSFDDEMIDKEKKVVIEEWRLGRGADARMRDKQIPVILKNSRYAERLPIGDVHTLETFDHDVLRKFYHDWYRPDLMAVVAVGDFDKDAIERLIVKLFSEIPARTNPRQRISYPVPDHTDTLFTLASDSEATQSGFGIYYKHDIRPQTAYGDYRRQLVEALSTGILNQRLSELARKPDPPFLYGYSSNGSLTRTKETYMLGAAVKDNGILKGMATVLTEAARVRQNGVTQTEIDRQKSDFLRSIENAFNERDKTESANYADECIRNFLTAEPIPGIAYEFELYKAYIPDIKLNEVNAVTSQFITDKNIVVTVNEPEKSGITMPTVPQLKAVLDSVNRTTVAAYIDTVSDQPLVPVPPTPGSVTEQKVRSDIGVTEWKLSNGIRVILKPTEFKNDQIEFTAFSPGGTSLVPDSDYIPAATATSIVEQGGLGNFDLVTLEKKLAGKIAGASPFISELEEGMSGNSSVKDAETMFQLVYLYFTAPRKDISAFSSYRTKVQASLENRSADPEAAFGDTVEVTLSQHHPRRLPWTKDVLDKLNLDKSYSFYRTRFADASDFTFLFVGNFFPDSIKPLVEKYLGGLPVLNRHDHWQDIGVRPPKGVIDKTVNRGTEPKSTVELIFTGPFEWSIMHRYELNCLADVLRIKLRQSLREDKGGTYDAEVGGSPALEPVPQYDFSISFGCDPKRADELTAAVFQQLDSLKKYPVDPSYIEKVKEIQRRDRETGLKQNGFWLSYLQFYYKYNEDPAQILNLEDRLSKLNPEFIQKAANTYLDMHNYVKAVLLPKESK